MRDVPTKRILARWQKTFKILYLDDLIGQILLPLSGRILALANEDGEIGFLELATLKNDAGRLVRDYFIGPTFRPLEGLTPISPFAQRLAYIHANVVYDTIHAHKRWMQRTLPKDVFQFLETVQSRPFPLSKPDDIAMAVRAKYGNQRVQQMVAIKEEDERTRAYPPSLNRIFHPNPLAQIDPERRWVPFGARREFPISRTMGRDPVTIGSSDTQSYRLSDNIWRTSDDTRNRINRVLQNGVGQGMSAVDLADRLERELLPSARNWRTFGPYDRFGTSSRRTQNWIDRGIARHDIGYSYNAMRLARTEISRSFNEAAYNAAYTNPFVTGIDWLLSNSHPKIDVCDDLADASPYPLNNAKIPPAHPHCLCTASPVVGNDNLYQRTIDGLRGEMVALENQLANMPPIPTPAQADLLLSRMLDIALDHFLPVDFVRIGQAQTVLPPPF